MNICITEELPSTVTLLQYGTGKQRLYAYDHYDPRRHVYVVDDEVWGMVNSELERLQPENAELRELVRDMGELLDGLDGCDLDCKHQHYGCVGDCYYVNARRELGIEV